MIRIFLIILFFATKISLIFTQSNPVIEDFKIAKQKQYELERAYLKSRIEQEKREREIYNLQKKVIELNYSLKSSCTTYNCVVGKVNDYLNSKNFQAAFDYLNLAESYSDKNLLEIANLRDKFFKLMSAEVKGNKLKKYTCSDYNCVIEKIKKALKIKDYQTAFENIESAESYPQKRDEQIKYLRKKLFDEIDKQRIAALTSRREAFTSAYELSKTKNELKETQKETEKTLTDLRNASDQAVLLLINEIDRNILRLEYDSTFEKCRIALNMKSEKFGQQVKERILEIAYWYTETDTFEAAIKTLNLLTINSLPNHVNLIEAIKKNCTPQYFTFLEERYYPKMISVEGGTFKMKKEGNPFFNKDDNLEYLVQLNTFKVAETETTVWQYFIYLKAEHKKPIDSPLWQYFGDNPMVFVTWYNSIEYCNWLSLRKGKIEAYTIDRNNQDTNNLNKSDKMKWIIKLNEPSEGYRLPSEAEWEYAARGGKYQSPFIYSGSNDINEVAWYSENSSRRTQSVKRLKPNALGLYDMSGNAWEWCFDWFSIEYNITSNNYWTGIEKGEYRVRRGGSWNFVDSLCRISDRFYLNPTIKYLQSDFGFRCVQYD